MLTESRVQEMRPKVPGESSDSAHGIFVNADNEYQAYSSQVSPIVRTLALTAIAVIWLFAGARSGSNPSPLDVLHRLELTGSLTVALALALCVLLVDLMQYVWGALSWATYRWSLEQIMLNDNFDPEDLPLRIKLGWLVARMFRVAQYLEYYGKESAKSTSKQPWVIRRNNLRKLLRKSTLDNSSSTSLKSALGAPWSPLIINRLLSFFFVSKIALLILCYAFLGKFLLY